MKKFVLGVGSLALLCGLAACSKDTESDNSAIDDSAVVAPAEENAAAAEANAKASQLEKDSKDAFQAADAELKEAAKNLKNSAEKGAQGLKDSAKKGAEKLKARAEDLKAEANK